MWTYQNELFTSEKIGEAIGFVYEVTDKVTGLKYIGKKKFWSTNRLPPLKGKKLKRKVVKESDWQKYCGSSEEVKAIVTEHGLDRFDREILRLCYSKGELNYYELKEQVMRDVLLKPDEYHNAFVGGKIHRSHLLKKVVYK
jgi:hypothetical protein